MFLNTANLKHHLAAAQRGRYALNAIALTSRGTLSTDGHALLFVPYPELTPRTRPRLRALTRLRLRPRRRSCWQSLKRSKPRPWWASPSAMPRRLFP